MSDLVGLWWRLFWEWGRG